MIPGIGTELLDLADADTLGSFSGDLAFSFSLDAKHNVSKPINNTADWQHAFLSNFLQQPASSTVPTLSKLVLPLSFCAAGLAC